jgi:hypothetical protein
MNFLHWWHSKVHTTNSSSIRYTHEIFYYTIIGEKYLHYVIPLNFLFYFPRCYMTSQLGRSFERFLVCIVQLSPIGEGSVRFNFSKISSPHMILGRWFLIVASCVCKSFIDRFKESMTARRPVQAYLSVSKGCRIKLFNIFMTQMDCWQVRIFLYLSSSGSGLSA